MRDFDFYCKPAKGEQINTHLTLTPDDSAAIYGRVSDGAENPIPGALVLLFREGALLAQAVTDGEGHFAFGALMGDVLYRIKVFQQNTRVRELELSSEDED
ncbi:MAG: carboxypeptidase-like regulatory domain-containing protein [Oscillospiraceae bacterium]|nr:carboxypeptidase-like regulatory domain-containing protein [Oscillospiraceae bacterium]